MKIPIKFRGRRVDNGEYIYGDLLTGCNEFAIINDTWRAMVYPDSVAQLVGYDVDGKEVYEGDTLTDILGNEYTARIRIELTCDDAQSSTRQSLLRGQCRQSEVEGFKTVNGKE